MADSLPPPPLSPRRWPAWALIGLGWTVARWPLWLQRAVGLLLLRALGQGADLIVPAHFLQRPQRAQRT